MLRLTPVVEIRTEHAFDWVSADASREWVELDANIGNDDIARVVANLASYNDFASSGSVEDVAHALERADSLILPGGLMIRIGALEIPPSCCCGLEHWREWYGVAPGGSSPWLGHSPSPWVECKADRAVLWADGELGDQSPNASIVYSEVDDALRTAHVALVAFNARLGDWLSTHAPQNAGRSRRFAGHFDISFPAEHQSERT
jgi:hypothetical protein